VNISNDKKAVIHVARSQVAMDEASYRLMLERVAGVTSSSDLDEAGFTAVMAEFERLGFRSTNGRAQKQQREGMATPAQIGKIRWLWKSYTGKDDEHALGRWLEKHFHVSHLRFLEDWRAGKAIAILLKMQAHPNAKHPQRRKNREAEHT
jgi:hypothetical protein